MRNEELMRAQLPTTLSRHAWHVIACYMYVQSEAKRATQAVEQLYFSHHSHRYLFLSSLNKKRHWELLA